MDNDIHEIAMFLTGREENGWDFTYAKKLRKGKWVLVLEKKKDKKKSQEAKNEETTRA